MAPVPAVAAAASQPLPAFLRLVSADELGLLRAVEVPSSTNQPRWDATAVVAKWGEPDRSRAVQQLAVSSLQRGGLLGVARKGGRIEILDADNGTLMAGLQASTSGRPADDPAAADAVGLSFLSLQQGSRPRPSLLAATHSGIVTVFAADAAAGAYAQAATLQGGAQALAAGVSTDHTRVALGGQASHLQVLDIESKAKVFVPKGGKPDKLRIIDTPFTTALAFVPGTGEQQVLAGTGGHKLWLYDARAGKRPQMDLAWRDARITCLAPEPSGKRIWVSNGQGYVEVLDLAAGRMLGALKGAGGSVRSLAVHPDLPLVAAVGLDRHLRLFDTASRQQLCKTYMKQQLTAVAFAPVLPVQVAALADGEPLAAAAADSGLAEAAGAPGSGKKDRKERKERKQRAEAAPEEGEGPAERREGKSKHKKHKRS